MDLFDILRGVFDEGESDDGGGQSAKGGESSDEEGEVKDVTEFGPAEFRREAEEFSYRIFTKILKGAVSNVSNCS